MSEIEKILDIILTHLDTLDNSCRMIKIQLKCLKGAINRDKSIVPNDKDLYLASIDELLKRNMNEINTASIRKIVNNMKQASEIHASSS